LHFCTAIIRAQGFILLVFNEKEVQKMTKQESVCLTEMQDLLELRTFAYDILRTVFLAEPTKEGIGQLHKGMIEHFPFKEEHSLLREGIDQVNHYLKYYERDEDFDALHWDYTRMFIGPSKIPCPIWESSYLNKEGLLFQEETLQVRTIYLKNQLMSLQNGREPEDHLGLELDFMYQLSNLATDLLKDKNVKQLHSNLRDQQRFLKEHLLTWNHLFCENVNNHAETDFYKGMAKILNGFLNIDKYCLEELLDTLQQ
jgi:TorA maturation chaperone TorD